MTSIKVFISLVALTVMGVAAADARESNRLVVRYSDLDLKSQRDVARLHKRIRNAAESVCGNFISQIFELHDAYEKCVEDASSRAVAAVGNSHLSDYHAAKGKSTVVASN
jgi:UrcA family protein